MIASNSGSLCTKGDPAKGADRSVRSFQLGRRRPDPSEPRSVDPLRNPFAQRRPPPELAGRSTLLQDAELALRRVRLGRAEKSQMLLGLRGVGKTVLLNRIAEQAEAIGYEQAQLEAPEGRPLADYLVPALKTILVRLDRIEQAKAWAGEAMAALRGFPQPSR